MAVRSRSRKSSTTSSTWQSSSADSNRSRIQNTEGGITNGSSSRIYLCSLKHPRSGAPRSTSPRHTSSPASIRTIKAYGTTARSFCEPGNDSQTSDEASCFGRGHWKSASHKKKRRPLFSISSSSDSTKAEAT